MPIIARSLCLGSGANKGNPENEILGFKNALLNCTLALGLSTKLVALKYHHPTPSYV